MSPAIDHDVVIIGAGPAGTAAAIRLNGLGLNTAIVEHASFPRPHVGICLSDQTLPLLNYLGLQNETFRLAAWQRKITAVRWGESETKLVPQIGFHVDRSQLDLQLLKLAYQAGTRVYQPARICESPIFKGPVWQLKLDICGVQTKLRARFIVNASGRRPAVKLRRIKDSPPLLAIHATWSLANPPAFDGLIQSGTDAWLWYARTSLDSSVVSVFCDPRQLKTASKSNLQKSYSHLLSQFSELKLSQIGDQSSVPQACNASSHHATAPVSDHHIHIGDARFSVDPLSSQGVHLAVQSGLQGAIVVHTILRKPKNTELAKQFFRERTTTQVNRYSKKTETEYARVAATCSNSFWHKRAGKIEDNQVKSTTIPITVNALHPATMLSISPETILETGAVIDGAYVEKQTILKHPNIDGSIAYINGVNLSELLASLPPKFVYRNIPTFWKDIVPISIGRKIADWLLNNEILVKAP